MTADLDKIEAALAGIGPVTPTAWVGEGGTVEETYAIVIGFVHDENEEDVTEEDLVERAEEAAKRAASVLAEVPALIAELRALRVRVADAEAEAAAEFAERKRVAEALRGCLVEANEKALEHLEARMLAEAERDAVIRRNLDPPLAKVPR